MFRMVLEQVKKNMPQIKAAIIAELKADAQFRKELKEALNL
jgi:hypothetical protein